MRFFPRLLLLLAVLLSLTTVISAQKVTLSYQHTPLETVLNSIKQQTKLSLVFSEQLVDVSRSVSIHVSKVEVKDALAQLFSGTNVDFEIKNNKLYLVERKVESEIINKKTINGVITDKNGEPIIGASVMIKNSSVGTITDMNGRFTVNASQDDVLVVSYIGFASQEIKVDRNNFEVILREDTKLLDEVVVIGYGIQKKRDLTGSISTVQGGLIEERKTAQLSTALQGSMSGVMVERTNSSPGSTGTIRIRGITTIGDSSPLIIVDGMPISNINDVNPNDVENISVLKDAASAAIYGARAASGVILITTKRGSSDKISLNYTYEYGIEKPTTNPKYVDVLRFMEMTNELRWNDAGNGVDEYPEYSKHTIENYYQLNADDPDTYPNTNW